MKLRLGQPVVATDGPFGTVADIIIDPNERTVTHLVVEPSHRYRQARLVPVWLADIQDDDTVNVSIDARHLLELSSVAATEFEHVFDPIDLGPEWEVGTETFVMTPNLGPEFGIGPFERQMIRNYDRIPRGECEIRRCSLVEASDGRVVGTVEGFIGDGDQLLAVVVRASRHGLRHYVGVPMDAVARVRTDLISLTLDTVAFQALPPTDRLFGPDDPPSRLGRVEHWAATTIHGAIKRMNSRYGRSS